MAPPGGVHGVEEGLGRGIGVGRAEHPGPQSIARDDVRVMERQVGHELHRPTGSVRGQVLLESLQPGRHGEQADVDGSRRERVRPPHGPTRVAGRRRVVLRVRSGGRRHELLHRGCGLGRLEMRADDETHRMQRGAVAVDQDGQVGRHHRLHRDHRAVGRDAWRERSRVPDEEHVARHEPGGVGLGVQRRVVGILGHVDRVRPGPRRDGTAGGAPQGWSRLPEQRQHVSWSEGDEPGSLGIVTDGKDQREVGQRRVVFAECLVTDVPRRPVPCSLEPTGRLLPHRLREGGR